MSGEGLPSCDFQPPSCGCCGSDCRNDGDGFICEDCGLSFGHDDSSPGEYLDDSKEPCGKSCGNSWHPTLGLSCTACKLPEGHTSDCWTDCKL